MILFKTEIDRRDFVAGQVFWPSVKSSDVGCMCMLTSRALGFNNVVYHLIRSKA